MFRTFPAARYPGQADAVPHLLTPLERTVIALARADRPASLRPQRRLSMLLFKRRPSPALANGKLEILRRYVVLIRHRRGAAEGGQLAALGYQPRQIAEIDRLAVATPFPHPSAVCRGIPPARVIVKTMIRPTLHFAAFAAGLSLAFWYFPANAQDLSGGLRQDASRESDEARDDSHIIVGLGAFYAPAYQGADKYRALPMPVIDLKWGPFFANLRNGIGMSVVDNKIITTGASITFMPGYRRNDVPDGIGNLSAGAGARGFVSLNAGGFVATVGGTKGITGGNKGVIADATLSYPITVTPRVMIIPTIGTTWTDAKYNDRYFGVDPAQSLASGLPQFRPGSGFKDASALLTVSYRLTDHITLGASGGVTTLLGPVKESPLVFHRTQPAGFLSAAYRFGR